MQGDAPVGSPVPLQGDLSQLQPGLHHDLQGARRALGEVLVAWLPQLGHKGV